MNSYLHTHYKSGAATPNYWLPGYKKAMSLTNTGMNICMRRAASYCGGKAGR